MSQAFVKEQEEEWLHDIQPTLHALTTYLTRQNNNVRVYEKDQFVDPKTRKPVYAMSNGLNYSVDESGRWFVSV